VANVATGRRSRFADLSLSHEQTVPNSIAHRRAVGEVFVTDSAQTGEAEFAVAFQVPRAHSLWGDRRTRFHDPFATAEAARQASFVVIHRHLAVPVGTPFTLRHYEFSVTDPGAYADDQRTPLEGFLQYRVSAPDLAGGTLGSLSLAGELEIGGSPAMAISGDVVFMTSDDYEVLRAFQRARKPLAGAPDWTPPAPYPAADVGRLDQRNVVIAPPLSDGPGDRYSLHIDRGHPSYFDHDYDHVPGPFIVEGFRQAAVMTAVRHGALPGPDAVLTSCRTDFADFGEFEAPLEYAATLRPGGHVLADVELSQFGKRIATGEIGLMPAPD
jgi:hypothetical protein